MTKKIGERIKEARNAAGLTQDELAKTLNISYPTLNKYEKGHTSPDGELLGQIVKVLNCDPAWLLTGEGEMKRGERAEKPLMAPEPVAVYNIRDIEMQEIVGFLKENPVDKKVILKLIKSKKMAKEALEEFAGVKGLVEEG